jgi:hypothetical protein
VRVGGGGNDPLLGSDISGAELLGSATRQLLFGTFVIFV